MTDPTFLYLVLAKGAYHGLTITLGILMTFVLPRKLKGRNPMALKIFGVALLTEGLSSVAVIMNMLGNWHYRVLEEFATFASLAVIGEIGMVSRALTEEKMTSLKVWLLTLVPLLLLFGVDLAVDAVPTIAMVATGLIYVSTFVVWTGIDFTRYENRLRDSVSNLTGRRIFPFIFALALIILNEALWLSVGAFQFPNLGNLLYTVLQALCWLILTIVLIAHKSMTPVAVEGQAQVADNAEEMQPAYDPSTKELRELGEKLRKLTEEGTFYLDSELGRDQLAAMLGCPRTLLSHYLSAELHTTFYDFVNGLRIKRAKQMLREGATDMERVALSCGYDSLLSFERAFFRITGAVPRIGG